MHSITYHYTAEEIAEEIADDIALHSIPWSVPYNVVKAHPALAQGRIAERVEASYAEACVLLCGELDDDLEMHMHRIGAGMPLG